MLLYAEMVTTGTAIHGPRGCSPTARPGTPSLCNSAEPAEASRVAEGLGYDGADFDCCCPSGRVRKGRFGACPMLGPALVGRCVAIMTRATALPVTAECRTGVEGLPPKERRDEPPLVRRPV